MSAPQLSPNDAALAGLQRVERLLENADAAWLLEHAVIKPHTEAERTLHDLAVSAEKRDRAAFTAEALRGVKDFLSEQRAIFERRSK